jgi:5-methylcytosine-specific restriction protein A
MAARIPKPCKCAGCSAVTIAIHGFCAVHVDKARQINWAQHQKKYGSGRSRYCRHWDQLREQVIARDQGLCQCCLGFGRITPGRDVDHIRSKREGGADTLANLQLLCRSCHNEKTQQEAQRGRAGQIPASKAPGTLASRKLSQRQKKGRGG